LNSFDNRQPESDLSEPLESQPAHTNGHHGLPQFTTPGAPEEPSEEPENQDVNPQQN